MGIVAALYWRTLYFGFVWDDPTLTLKILPNYQHLIDVFMPLRMSDMPLNYYRPLAFFSWMIDRTFWGTNPFGYHATEIMLHAVNVVLVYFLTKRLLARYESAHWGALAAALIFAVHPVQTEAVCWISCRPEILFTAFVFGSFLSFIHFRDTQEHKWLILSLVCWFLGLLTKETAVALLPCLIVYDIFFTAEKRKALRCYAWHPVVFLVYLLLRQQYLYSSGGHFEFGGVFGILPQLLKRLLSAYDFYVQRALFPYSLSGFVPELAQSKAFIFGVLIIGIWAYWKKNRLLLYFILFFLITLLPSSLIAITNVSQTPVAERYLYLPMYAVSFLAGLAVAAIPGGRYIKLLKYALLLAVLILLGYKTVLRIPVWQNDLTFFQTASMQNPNHGIPYQLLGNAYHEINDYPHAIEYYHKAISAPLFNKVGIISTYNNLGKIYTILKRYDKAEEYFQKALKKKDASDIYYYLGYLYLEMAENSKKGRKELLKKAISSLEECLKRSPDDKDGQVLLTKARSLLR